MKTFFALLLALSVPAQSGAQAVSQGNPGVREIALTFDAGSDRGYASLILQILERNHIHVSFGMTGRWAEANRDLLRRMARDGDTFMDHTYDHRSFTGLSTGLGPLTVVQRTWEIQQAETIIHRETGLSGKPYFRPPYGDYDAATLTLLGRLGYRYMIMWTVDTLGWNHLPADQIVTRSVDLARPGAIYVMHVGSQSQDALALQSIISQLSRRHYRLVTIPELIRDSHR